MATLTRVWNANTLYHHLILAALPAGALRVLDVGCGDGLLLSELVAAGVPQVVGIDADRGVLDRAQQRLGGLPIEWLHGDALRVELDAESFDAVVSVAALHHMDAEQALRRFVQLVRPGGVVVVIGLAAANWWDLPLESCALVSREVLKLVKPGFREHSAPIIWPPPLTYRQMKTLGARVLPGVQYRRHLLGRFSLIWRKPAM